MSARFAEAQRQRGGRPHEVASRLARADIQSTSIEATEVPMGSDIRGLTADDVASSSHMPAAERSRPCAMSDDDRAARMNLVWEKYLAGQLVTLDEYISHRDL